MSLDNIGVEAVQIIGALLVLACFLLAQAERINPNTYRYLLPNLVGSTAMTVTAVIGHEWGFVFLESVWALVSALGLIQHLRGKSPSVAHRWKWPCNSLARWGSWCRLPSCNSA